MNEKVNDLSQDKKISRRDFFSLIGWGGLLSSILISLSGTVRFLFPNVLFEPPSTFKLGKPEDYKEGSVTYDEEHRIFIFHDKDGFRCVSAICTHVACVVNWNEADNEFICPCHGSKFTRAGKVITGAAIKPLPSFLVTLAKDGRLLVDTKKTVDPKYRLKLA
ncbi:MAG: ubiquinol-cytochrome c reductase iron-sulfur subunit [Candidatus Zixiibacteriota bacterium]